MKKKSLPFFLILVLFCFPAVSYAGSMMVGMKGWYAFWEGWPNTACTQVDDAVDEAIVSALLGAGATTADSDTNSEKETGKGYLAGPMLAYQTDDRMWSFSLAFMYFSDFKYETTSSGTFSAVIGVPMSGINFLSYNIELKRREIDVALSRSITSWMKVFGGYKYLRTENKLEIRGSLIIPPATVVGTVNSDVEITSNVHIPTAGIGLVFPLSSSVFFGLQGGILYLIPTSETKSTDNEAGTGDKYTTDFNNSFGVNLEATLSVLAFESIMLQLGYRYQGMQIEAKVNESVGAYSVWDSFHGVTLSALYIFSL